MVRPRKQRRIGHRPKEDMFCPKMGEFVELEYEELEAIRLMDYEDLTQKEASELMNVGRTTLQAIYKRARSKVAIALVENKNIRYKDNDCYEFYLNKGRIRGKDSECTKRKNCPKRRNKIKG